MIVAVPVLKIGESYYLSPHFGRAPYFAFVEVEGNRYRILEVVENPYMSHEHRRGVGVVNFIVSHRADTVIVVGIGHGAFTRLKERGVKIYYTPWNRGGGVVALEEAMQTFINGGLEEAGEPHEYG